MKEVIETGSPSWTEASQAGSGRRWLVLAGLLLALLAVFVGRTWLARSIAVPRLFELFDTITVFGSLAVLAVRFRRLRRADWAVAAGVGLFIGLQLPFARLFHPYPFLGVIHTDLAQAVVRGSVAMIAALGGLAIRRSGGPVRVALADGAGRPAARSFLVGALLGVPLAALNVVANGWTQGRAIVWQNPLAAAVDALQPAVVEEVVYRLAFLGLLWLVLRRTWPERQAAALAGLLALLVHSYAHFSEEWLTQPLTAFIMGTLLALVWGVPPTLLALRRDLESATGFHWVQDFARFWAGL